MKKILIVEDEVDIVKVLTKRLTEQDLEVVVANEGYQGIALAHQEKPDLIILDLMLPTGDGMSVLKNLQLSQQTELIPIMVLTGKKDEEYKQKILGEGIKAYLEKPYDPDQLITIVKNILVV